MTLCVTYYSERLRTFFPISDIVVSSADTDKQEVKLPRFFLRQGRVGPEIVGLMRKTYIFGENSFIQFSGPVRSGINLVNRLRWFLSPETDGPRILKFVKSNRDPELSIILIHEHDKGVCQLCLGTFLKIDCGEDKIFIIGSGSTAFQDRLLKLMVNDKIEPFDVIEAFSEVVCLEYRGLFEHGFGLFFEYYWPESKKLITKPIAIRRFYFIDGKWWRGPERFMSFYSKNNMFLFFGERSDLPYSVWSVIEATGQQPRPPKLPLTIEPHYYYNLLYHHAVDSMHNLVASGFCTDLDTAIESFYWGVDGFRQVKGISDDELQSYAALRGWPLPNSTR